MDTAIKKLNDRVISIKYGTNVDVFWYEKFNTKGGKDYTILLPQLRVFIHELGYRNFNNEPVKVIDNIIFKVTPDDIFKDILNYIEGLNEPELESAFLRQGETHIIKNKSIILGLKECEKDLIKDTDRKCHHFYRNGVVLIKANAEMKLLDYKDIKGLVWNDSIIDRDFEILKDSDEVIGEAMFYKFVSNITNDDVHRESLLTVFGYLLHKYKDQRKPIAIIINDENLIDEGNPNGGTGKGLIIKAISHIIEKAIYNGKNADFTNNRFAYQNVKKTTNLLVIDDAPRNFDFEALFSVLTDDMPIERKHKPIEVLPYEESPKIVITTNYSIKGNTSSFKRRRFDTFLNNYYSDQRTPSSEFGCEFFNGWDEVEWKRFDFMMMACVRLYLTFGLIPFDSEELKLKRLKNETSGEFFELMELYFNDKNISYPYSDVRQKLISQYGEKFHFLDKSHKIVVEWVDKYADFKNLEIDKKRTMYGYAFKFI